jgi:hypothetical protein
MNKNKKNKNKTCKGTLYKINNKKYCIGEKKTKIRTKKFRIKYN